MYDLLSGFKKYIESKNNINIDWKLFVPFEYSDSIKDFIIHDSHKYCDNYKITIESSSAWETDSILDLIIHNIEDINTYEYAKRHLNKLNGMVYKVGNTYNIYIRDSEYDYINLLRCYIYIKEQMLSQQKLKESHLYCDFRSTLFSSNQMRQESYIYDSVLNFAVPYPSISYQSTENHMTKQNISNIYRIPMNMSLDVEL